MHSTGSYAKQLGRLVLLLLAFTCAAMAQEYRATILGTVVDPSGAIVPGADVALTNIDTGVRITAQSNNVGNYTVPYLLPGTYRIAVTHAGFKTFDQSPLEVHVSDRLRVDVRLETGLLTETVRVTAEAPILETASANRGQVVNELTLETLPVNSRNPYTILALSSGVHYTGSQIYYRPFDNGAIESYSINGGPAGMNEFQMDGIPQGRAGSNNVAYVPPLEATEEFKVQTNTYDAQYGHTGGGVVNISIKSGTNDLHGQGYWYIARDSLSAYPTLNVYSGLPKPQTKRDHAGVQLAGPVYIPHLYNGKNKTFFMFTDEEWRENSPLFGSGNSLATVPSDLERAGNFSNTRQSNGNLVTIYDPLSITPNPNFNASKSVSVSNLQYLRTAFPNNAIPTASLNPIALNLLQAFPHANQAGTQFTQANNFFADNPLEVNNYYNRLARVDQALGEKWRINARWNRSYRNIRNPTGQKGYNTDASTGAFWSARVSDGAALDAVHIVSATSILNFRVGFNRFNTFALFTKSFDQSAYGFPKSLLSALPLPNYFPVLSFSNYSGTANPGDNTTTPSNTFAAQANWTKILGPHTIKVGAEYRVMQYGYAPTSNAMGNYSFSQSFTQVGPQVTDAASGNAIASFLLGDLSSASANINATPLYSWRYPAIFFQDEWQVSRDLSLSLGLRWDYEMPVTERFNMQIRGFNYQAQSPLQVPGYNLRGGLLFAGVNGAPRGAFNPDKNNFQPRFGMAYRPFHSKSTVIRGGFGIYFLPTTETGQNNGFSATTSATVSTPGFLPAATLSNAFPTGLIQPAGSSQGLSSLLGSSITFNNVNRVIPKMWQYSFGMERELFRGFLLEVTYVGSRTNQMQVGQNLNALTASQLALGTAYLNTAVTNPFYGVLAPNTTQGAQPTIQQRNLMVAYPQYSGVTRNANNLGSSWYNALQMRLERRFSNGLSFLLSYTDSKTMEALSYKNAQDAQLSREISGNDVPQSFVASGMYQLPWGRGKKLLNKGIAATLLGNWVLGAQVSHTSGTPLGLPNYYINGNPALPAGQQTLTQWFDTTPSLWTPVPADTLRVAPLRSPNIRNMTGPQVNLTMQKQFRFNERHSVEFRAQAFNFTNTPLYGSPNTTPTSPLFGQITVSQINLPRQVELALTYRF
jgi:hypothetical protein